MQHFVPLLLALPTLSFKHPFIVQQVATLTSNSYCWICPAYMPHIKTLQVLAIPVNVSTFLSLKASPIPLPPHNATWAVFRRHTQLKGHFLDM